MQVILKRILITIFSLPPFLFLLSGVMVFSFLRTKKAALRGNAKAQFKLGVMYENGHGVLQDYANAVILYKKAALQGDAKAQFNLGVMYSKGQGVLKNYKIAINWYEKAAFQNFVQAQTNFGGMYYQGKGVVQNHVAAYLWFAIAEANRGKTTREGLSLLENEMTPAQVKEAQELVPKVQSIILSSAA